MIEVHDLKTRYERYREQEMEKVRAMFDGETLPSMAAAIREELAAEGTFPAMIGTGIRIRLDALFEERAGILPYDEWQNQKRPSSKGQTA
jgi:hypothetical protein